MMPPALPEPLHRGQRPLPLQVVQAAIDFIHFHVGLDSMQLNVKVIESLKTSL